MMNIQNPYQNQQIPPQQLPPEQQEHLKCPRCDSNNTKFCYYNNYNLSQPRYYCKNCRRYWTKGGALRNIPIGGGSRKNTKRSSIPKKKSSVSLSVSTISEDSGFKPEPGSINGAPVQNDHDQCPMIDVNGSFSSLLAGFNSSGSGIRRMPFGDFSESLSSGTGLELDMGRNPVLDLGRGIHSESFLGKYSGDSSCWNGGSGGDSGGYSGGGDGNGWPDLSI